MFWSESQRKFLPVAAHSSKTTVPPMQARCRDSPRTLSPSFLLAQAIFEPSLFPYNTTTFSNLVILHTYLPMTMEQCSETWACKIQMPGNYPEESIQH